VKKKKYSRQQIKKRIDGKCLLCDEHNYKLLDAHRIVEGGTYHSSNVITVCCNCHRSIHSENIKVDRKYFSTKGHWIVHLWMNDKEYWIDETERFTPEPPAAEY
jgi:hypothetical protein